MISPKFALIGAALSLAATASFADATMQDIVTKTDAAISVKMDRDAKAHVFDIAIGKFGVVDMQLAVGDADYEAVLADRGMVIGAALYGQFDASYDAWLTPTHFFETAALGQNDADYEPVLKERGIKVGAAIYGQHDADYDAVLFPQPDGCQTGAACF